MAETAIKENASDVLETPFEMGEIQAGKGAHQSGDGVTFVLFRRDATRSTVIEKMSRDQRLAGEETGYTYTALVPATRPARDYTPRLVPQREAASIALEAPIILWHDAPSWRRLKDCPKI